METTTTATSTATFTSAVTPAPDTLLPLGTLQKMSATVLGKRSRVTTIADSPNAHACAKRRITIASPNDENRNPFVTRGRNEDNGAQGDGLLDEEPIHKRTRNIIASTRKSPTKLNAPESLGVTSPSRKDLSSRKRSRSIVDIYQDGNPEQGALPRTPRHRDALQKVTITPRHRVLVTGDQNTPRSAKKLGTPSHASTSIFNQARQLFARCSNPGKIIGRDAERAELAQFVQSRMQSQSGGCLYVSGPPGTGKSALLGDVISQWSKDESIKVSVVNCMSVRTTKDLSQKLAEDLDLAEDTGFDCLRSIFTQSGDRLFLVVLDEVDCLVDLDLALLYNLFEWSLEAESSLILIGIANALDLTDRLLPRLKTRNLKPDLLPFMPYTAAQISEVLTAKLRSLVGEESQSIPFLQPAAIQFCAKKVAAQTGDLRKAFDICQRAIDLVANESRDRDEEKSVHDSPSKIPLMENCNLASPHSPQSPTKTQRVYTLETAPKATIAHIARVTAQAFGNGATQRLAGLNLQQKAVLCALAALEKRKRDTQMQKAMFSTPSKTGHGTAPTIKQLFETYSALCKREQLFHALSSLEFRDVVSGLEGLNLITPADGRSGSFGTPLTPSRTPSRRGRNSFAGPIATGDDRRMASAVSKKEIECAIQNGPGGELLREMLEGDVSL